MSDGFDVAARMGELRRAEVEPRRQELRRLAAAGRLVIDRLVATRAPEETLRDAADQLERIAALLGAHEQRSSYEGFAESSTSGDPHAFFDSSPLMGLANPLAPPLRLWEEDGRVHGRAVFGVAYEGPPTCVHGGYIAAAFDEVLGMAQSLGGKPGMTARLVVDYRRPTPLRTELRFEGELERVEGRKIFTRGRLFAGDVLTAEAEGLFVSVDFEAFGELMRRKAAGEGPD